MGSRTRDGSAWSRRTPSLLVVAILGLGASACSSAASTQTSDPEAVKANETGAVQTFCISASWGSLIHATVGSAGGVGRPANREGLAA